MGSTPFLGQIMAVAFNFAPKGWALCNGQVMAINTNQALFALLGTTYGGNGIQTFALPDLRGRVAMGVGGGFQLGNTTGEETHTLTSNEMPLHQHPVSASAVVGTQAVAAGNLLGNAAMYNASPPDPAASTDNLIAAVGGSQPHENRPPYLVMTWIIALQGIFPSRN